MTSTLMKQGKKLAAQAGQKIVDDAIKERDKTINRPHNKKKSKDDPVDDIVRLAASGIGLVSEAMHHRKEKKKQQLEADKARESDEARKTEPQLSDSQSGEPQAISLPPANEPLQLELPARASPSPTATQESASPNKETEPTPEDAKPDKDSKKKKNKILHAQDFIDRHPLEEGRSYGQKLEAPVVLPQRRPKTRARGFLRAYAPVLDNAGVDQEVFLDFVDTFNKVLEPNPWINAINLAGFADVAFADPLLMLVGVGLQLATEAIMEGQSRFRSNRFLDRLNSGFFMPRGLICMVVTWKPEAIDDELITTVDVTHKEFGEKTPGSNAPVGDDLSRSESLKMKRKTKWKEAQEKMRALTKASEGYGQWPNPAPLVYPEPVKPKEGEKKKNKVDRMEDWLGEFADKKAQQEWREEHENDPMVDLLPKPEFKSRYSKADHPAASGDLVALITGGRWGGRSKAKEEQEEIDSSDEEAQRKEIKAQRKEVKELRRKAKKQKEEEKSLSSGLVSLLKGVSTAPTAF